MLIHGFELVKKREIKELNSEALLYRHKKTKAELLSMINDDENKVFGITFRTPPDDSTGLPHILEHSVLCGSRKYPVKEPFVELLKSSLQTFLNAMTYPDKTCYPVASQNLKDFYNLVDVYLDAVFYPRINSLIFEQEGWHYEINKTGDPLSIKGVVYSEMKGAYSSPDNLLARYSQQSLFPDNAYSLESGGDPKDIPSLTYEKFRKFHREFYHPSNARIFFYGDNDPDERLRLVDDYLKDFDHMSISSGINLQKRFAEPVKMEVPFVAEAGDGKVPKGMITVNWLLCETRDIKTNFALQVLSHILLGMPASPLRKALIESGLGEGLAGAGMETELREMYFSVGLKGMDIDNAGKVEELINKTLLDLSRGIDPLTIEAAINSIEFALRENNTGSYPRGLSIMLRSLTTWLYDADPFALIAFEDPLGELKKQYKEDPAFFEKMIERFFIRNTHKATVVLKPDIKLGEIERAAEIEDLDKKKSLMGRDDIIHLIEGTKTLKEAQETPDPEEALALIPSLKLHEIDRENKAIPILGGSDGTRIYYHDINTNGILYMDIGFGLNDLPQRFLPYVNIFGRSLLEMGTDSEDYVSLSQRINRKTGGIGRGSFSSMVLGRDIPTSWLFLRGKAMTHQVEDMLAIFSDLLLSVKLDNRDRFKQIVLEAKSALEQSIIPAGNRYVNLRIRSHFNSSDSAEEQMSGISALFFLRDLVRRIENNWDEVLRDLEDIRRILVNRNNMIMNATIGERDWNACRGRVESLFKEIPASGKGKGEWQDVNPAEFEGLTIPSQVNYVGKGADLYKLGYEYNGSVNVISHYLRTSYLWERVRVQGGAYGAMCQFNRMSGVLTFVSYRDPNLKKTLDIYDGASAFLKSVGITEAELHKSIIGAVGDIDTYMLPDAKGFTSLAWALNGNSDETRQAMRDQVLGTSLSDFRAFADVLGSVKDSGIVKILGGQNAFSEAFSPDGMPEMVKVL